MKFWNTCKVKYILYDYFMFTVVLSEKFLRFLYMVAFISRDKLLILTDIMKDEQESLKSKCTSTFLSCLSRSHGKLNQRGLPL